MTTLGLLLLLLIAIVYIDGWITIFNKAGYNSLWGLAMLVPVLNVIAFLLLAYGQWPNIRSRQLRR